MNNKKESVLEDTKKQTAVNWLLDCMPTEMLNDNYIQAIFKQAKELEKKQIEDAFEIGADDIYYAGNKFEDGKEFYKETYDKDIRD